MKKKKVKIPLGGRNLTAIEKQYDALKKVVEAQKKDVDNLPCFAVSLSDKEAKLLNCGIQVRNIRNIAKSIRVYFAMMEMLLENLQTDINDIHLQQKMYAERFAFIEAEDKAEAKQE